MTERYKYRSGIDRFPLMGDGHCVRTVDALMILSIYRPKERDEQERYEWALNRFRALANRVWPTPPERHRSAHGKRYDNYTCGGCGAAVSGGDRYCSRCGRAIGWETEAGNGC